MLTHSESLSHSTKRHKLPIPGAAITPVLDSPIQIATSRLIGIENQIFEVKQRQKAGHRRGHSANELKRKKRLLGAERDSLAKKLIELTATKKAKEVKPIVLVTQRQKTLVERLPAPLARSLAMAGLALSLLAPGMALAEGGPTPEPTHPVPVSGHTFNIGKTGDDRVSWWIKRGDLRSPPVDVGQIQVAIANTYGAMVNPAGCADQIVESNIAYVETEAAVRARLNIGPNNPIYSSQRLIPILEARMTLDLVRNCALKAKQVIKTVSPLPPSKIPSTMLPTKTSPSSTPIKSPTATPPLTETPSTTDATGEYINYGLGCACGLALLFFGSLVALVVRNGKKGEAQDPPEEPAKRDPELIGVFVRPVNIITPSPVGADGVRVDMEAVQVLPGYKNIPFAESALTDLMRSNLKGTYKMVGGDARPQEIAQDIQHEKEHLEVYLKDEENAQGATLGSWVSAHLTDKGAVVKHGAATYPKGAPKKETHIKALKAVKNWRPSPTDIQQLRELGGSYDDEDSEPKK